MLRDGLQRAPGSCELWYNMGNALAAQGAGPEAVAAYGESLKIEPRNYKALLNLGNVLRARHEFKAAIERYQKALAIEPHNHDGHNNLGTALWAAGRVDEALQALHRAIEVRPDSSAAHNNLGNVLKDTGRMDAAIAAFRRAVELAPHDSQPHSNLLYSLYFHPGYDEVAILREAGHGRARMPPQAPATAPRRSQATGSAGRLHIGYVSPDFREHCQSLFTCRCCRTTIAAEFKIHCYAQLPAPDATSQRLAGFADVWRSIHSASDAEVEAMIVEDDIDILVDLTMHMSNGRPLAVRAQAGARASGVARLSGHDGPAGDRFPPYRSVARSRGLRRQSLRRNTPSACPARSGATTRVSTPLQSTRCQRSRPGT